MWFLVSQLHAYVCERAKVILHMTFITWPFIDFQFLIQLSHSYHQLTDSGSFPILWFYPPFFSQSFAVLVRVCTRMSYLCTFQSTSCKHAIAICLSISFQWLTEEIVMLSTFVAMLLMYFSCLLVYLKLEKCNFILLHFLCSDLIIPGFSKSFCILACYCNIKHCYTTDSKCFQL